MFITTTQRPRPRSLRSSTTRLNTEYGKLYVTVAVDEDDRPYEVFGRLGKGGSFQSGVTELVCRLISLHLRSGTPLQEILRQCRGIGEMQPFFNGLPGGDTVPVLGIGDGIAHILREYLVEGEPLSRRKDNWPRQRFEEDAHLLHSHRQIYRIGEKQ